LGHDVRLWLALGMMAGPTSIALVVRALKDHELVRPTRIVTGRSGSGPVDLLAGVDGSPDSEAALIAATDLLADRLGRLVIAAVADFDAAFPGGAEGAQDQARQDLDQARAVMAERGLNPDLVLLFGTPASALVAHARDHGFELISVGRRGRGMAGAAFGSVATQLARTADVPVLISSG
jgi:nucleotide-binding universal stress UspA family protein